MVDSGQGNHRPCWKSLFWFPNVEVGGVYGVACPCEMIQVSVPPFQGGSRKSVVGNFKKRRKKCLLHPFKPEQYVRRSWLEDSAPQPLLWLVSSLDRRPCAKKFSYIEGSARAPSSYFGSMYVQDPHFADANLILAQLQKSWTKRERKSCLQLDLQRLSTKLTRGANPSTLHASPIKGRNALRRFDTSKNVIKNSFR